MKSSFFSKAKYFLKERFDLAIDKGDEDETIASIKRSIEFKGTNLWILICAILIASLGLNMDSTAVIIGAMLISPIMGPIMGMGLGMGINDFDLLKRSLKNYLVATVIGILTSAIYFILSPLGEAKSELIARTTPSIYDVLIAFFGGLAGMLAASSKEKGNVITGVAIATALMPPLCTAGYGIAHQNITYFLGAFYLYLINTVFISWATFLGARFFRFSPKHFLDKEREKRVRTTIAIIVLLTMIPSILIAYFMIRTSVFENNAEKFISKELRFPNAEVVSKKIDAKARKIEVRLIGEEVPKFSIDIAQGKIEDYNLKDVLLVVNQNTREDDVDLVGKLSEKMFEKYYKSSELKIQILNTELDELKTELNKHNELNELSATLAPELKVVFPEIEEMALALTVKTKVSDNKSDTSMIAIVKFDEKLDEQTENRDKIKNWLKARTKTDYPIILLEE